MSLPTPPLALLNGNLLTFDPERPLAEAVLVTEGKVRLVGTSRQVESAAPAEARRIELGNATLLPGFIDTHAHIVTMGLLALRFDLSPARSVQEAIELAGEEAQRRPHEAWITGRGWDETAWPPLSRDFSYADALSLRIPDRPVFLFRVDGHTAWVNRRALRLGGIAADTPDPEGGRILRNARGHPTGILIDNAMELVKQHIPEPDEEETRRAIELCQQECFSHGLTTVHDAWVKPGVVQAYRKMDQQGELQLGVYGFLTGNRPEFLDEWFARGPLMAEGNKRFTLRAVKVFADGALGSRGAALFEPYDDDPAQNGLFLTPPDQLEQLARRCVRHGFQLAAHAIGDRANRMVLDVYENVLSDAGGPSPRFRIEHAQLLHAADVPRFGQLGITVAVQPVHCTADKAWVRARLGPDRLRYAYAWQSLRRHDARLIGGSDFPIAPLDPRKGLYGATTRQDEEGNPPGGWNSEECLSIRDALDLYTVNAAWAGFEENRKGRIAPGFLADLVAWDCDPTRLPPREILHANILLTIAGGKVVFSQLEEP